MGVGGALLWVSCGEWGIILGGWGWVDLSWAGILFWVNGAGWGCMGIILGWRE